MDSARLWSTNPILIIIFFLSLSCSVMEVRNPCPCDVDVFWQERDKVFVGLYFWNEGRLILSDVSSADVTGGRRSVRVERGMNRLCALKIPRMDRVTADGVRVSFGSQADSLYCCSMDVDCSTDVASASLLFHKEFATLRFSFAGVDAALYPFDLVLRSDVCGISFPGMEMVAGRFEYRLHPEKEEGACCRVLRQGPGSLDLCFVRKSDGSVQETVPLGDELAAMGYDWQAEDLSDVDIMIDYEYLRVRLAALPWEEEFCGEVKY